MVHEHYNQKWLRRFGAMAIGNHIYYYYADPSARLRKHEHQHVEQYREASLFGWIWSGYALVMCRWFIEYVLGLLYYRNSWVSYNAVSYEIDAMWAEER